jgi:ABC-type amino acid transport substrate-binding protein
MTRTLQKVALLATLALSFVSFTHTAAADSPVLDRVVSKGELRVGMSGNQPPFNAKSRTGQMIGFDVDLAGALASAMDVKLNIVNKPFAELIQAMNDGKVDMVISGVSITPERARHVSFVGPYMLSGPSILTRDSVLAKVQDSEEFNKAHLEMAVLGNSTSEAFVKRYLPEAKIIVVKDYDEGVEKVMKGSVDALVADMNICRLSVMRFPDAGLMTLNRPMAIEPIGIAVPANDEQFKSLVENYVSTFERAGLVNQIRKKWLEDGSWVAALP